MNSLNERSEFKSSLLPNPTFVKLANSARIEIRYFYKFHFSIKIEVRWSVSSVTKKANEAPYVLTAIASTVMNAGLIIIMARRPSVAIVLG